MSNKNKITLFGMLTLAFALIFLANAQAQVCNNDSFSLNAPSVDLISGEPFNLTFVDINAQIIGEPVWLNYSTLSMISGTTPQTIQNIDGSGYAFWTLNSPAGGNYNVSVIVPYNSTANCTIIKNITIVGAGLVGTPNVTVIMTDWTTINASKDLQDYPITYNNIGTGNAINVATLFNYITPNGLFSYSRPSFNLTASSSTTQSYTLNNQLCGLYRIDTTTTYKNELGNLMTPVIKSEEFNVSGSDLQITAIYVPQTSYYNGQTINAIVSITNNNQSVHGIIPANASNVTVYFDDYRCSSVGSIAIWGVQNFSCSYRISETFSSTRTVNYVVRVEANNDCMNYASLSNYKTQDVAITVRITSSGGGGSGGDDEGDNGGSTHVSICGNKICEIGETSTSCATDCGQIIVTPIKPTTEENGIYVYSEDGKAFVYLQSGTKTFMDKMPVINPREWIIIEDGNITTKMPYGVSIIRQYEFIPNGLEFIPDATISFKYSPLELKNGVYLMYFNSEDQKWVFIDANVDSKNNLISSKTSHFSTYALVTKENYPILTGFVLVDSMIGFISQNLIWDAIILGAIILVMLIIIYSLNRKDKKKKK